MSTKMTKQVNLTQDFIRRANADPSSGLASMFLAAFGVDLSVIIAVMIRAIIAKDTEFVIFCLTAGVQIRGNVTWVSRDFDGIRSKYPEFIIEGRAGIMDIFNFGAAHAAGHFLAHLASHSYGQKVLQKAGSCITGEFGSTSEAGMINKEIADSWTQAAKMDFSNNLLTNRTQYGPFVDETLVSILKKGSEFNKTQESKSSGSPALASKAGG